MELEKWQEVFAEGKALLLDKPLHWTSFDVVKKIRGLIKISKVGHAGTLDPLATGLLIVCTGGFTKKINEYMAREKEYSGTITIGSTTPTYDLESFPMNFADYSYVTNDLIRETVAKFTGEISQVPPAHSAIKLEGKPAYLFARKGKPVELKPRKVFIHEFEIVNTSFPFVDFRVVCSTGTYIRSLANDFGKALGCGAYLSALCRRRIGEFSLDDAITVEQFESQVQTIKEQFRKDNQ